MRKKRNEQMFFEFGGIDPKTLEELEMMDEILQKCEKVLDLVAVDLASGAAPDKGRPGMSAEQVLRVAIVKQMNSWSYEKLYFHLNDSIGVRRFCQYEFDAIPKTSTLHENIKKLTPATFEALNREIIGYAKKERIEDGKRIRIDTTVVETNIHHPTDSSLIVDAVRAITRILRTAREAFPRANITFHDRNRVMKKLHLEITNAKTADGRSAPYKRMLKYAVEVLDYGSDGVCALESFKGTSEREFVAEKVAAELSELVSLLAQIIDQTIHRVVDGEKVPASDKVVSVFEPHTDIIEKGGRETEFGHKVCVTVGRGNLVLDCMIERGNPSDSSLFVPALDRHVELYRRVPHSVASDGGFASASNGFYAREIGVKNVSFNKRVGKALKELLPSKWIRRTLFRFRAGVEAIISALKRGVGMTRCLWRGWESFQSYVWSGIVAHNIKMLSRRLLSRRKMCVALI